MEISTKASRVGRWLLPTIMVGVVGMATLTAGVLRAQPSLLPAYLRNFPDFQPAVTPQMPGDVDINLKTQLEQQKKFAQVQREFDLYSWQMFLALNWPTDNQGQAAPSLTDTGFGPPHWTLWHNSSSIFQADGAAPQTCGQPRALRALALHRDLTKPVSRGLAAFSTQATANADVRKTRFLGVISAVGELNASKLSDIAQAFSGPLIDQNGEFVFYEIMLDPNEVNYICANKLYNINGQIAFSKAGGQVGMPWGTPSQDWSGAFELKFAWKILKPGVDDFSRFYTTNADVWDQGADGKPIERRNLTVGLVGMHISHKSRTSPQWIWSTFEQVDNIDVDPVAHPNLHPSFVDPNCPICTVDNEPEPKGGPYPRVPTQVWRSIPISAGKRAVNDQASVALAKMGSVWQYYQLIDTQWPTVPSAKPSPWNGGLADAVANKPGGRPTPVFLTNVTMETYFQGGNQPACNGEELPAGVTCPNGGALPPFWTSPLNNSGKPVTPGVNTQIFVSESCMGCHSSAGVWTSYDPAKRQGTTSGQLTADFSWLLSKKAQYYMGTPAVAPPQTGGRPAG
jgi:hypothetical protein